jgi:hypothetical protein
LDVIQARFTGADFVGVFFSFIPQRRDVLVAEEGVVVEVDLGIQHHHVALLCDRQRVDLREAGVLLEVALRQRHEDLHHRADLFVAEAEIEGHLLGLEWLQTEFGIHSDLENLLWSLVCDFFDVHAAFG